MPIWSEILRELADTSEDGPLVDQDHRCGFGFLVQGHCQSNQKATKT